jgi:putative transposase
MHESLSHTKWDCKCQVVFIPKCRRRTIYAELRPHLGEVFRKLALQTGAASATPRSRFERPAN